MYLKNNREIVKKKYLDSNQGKVMPISHRSFTRWGTLTFSVQSCNKTIIETRNL